jgi:hypothetical protein
MMRGGRRGRGRGSESERDKRKGKKERVYNIYIRPQID